MRKIIAEQSIPKIDDFTARLSIVLWERDRGHYVTHVRNDDDGGFANGHYGMTLPEAWQDFGERVAKIWPTVDGVPYVPPAAAEENGDGQS